MFASYLPAPVRGLICGAFHMFAVLLLAILVFVLAFVKYLIPNKRWRLMCGHALNHIPVLWTDINEWIMRTFSQLNITLIGAENLSLNQWYLMTANHRSWTDVLILYRAFNHRIPSLRFFMKSQLLWVPFLGWGCWFIGYPFMKRYSKETLAKNPSLKGKDLLTTKKLCDRFRQENIAMTIISFAEGTRYTKAKAEHQHTPFKNLLKPRAGGLAYSLMAMEDMLHQFLDITLVYPTEKYGYWDYLCGRTKKVVIKVDCYPITPQFIGDYDNSAEDRARFQSWLNTLWEKKDLEIDRLKQIYQQ